jgi:hypothetical protein
VNQIKRHIEIIFISLCILTGCTSKTPFEKISFPGKLLVYHSSFGESNFGKAYVITQGNASTLIWNTKFSTVDDHELIVSPGLTYANDQGTFFNLKDGHIVFSGDTTWNNEKYFAYSPDDRYIVISKVWQGIILQELPTNKKIELVSPKCQSYSAVGSFGTSACLWIGQPLWLDNQTLLFVNDKGMFSNDYDFPDKLTSSSNGNQNVLQSGKGKEVSAVDLNGTVRSISDNAELLSQLANIEKGQYFNNGDTLYFDNNDENDVWVSKKDLKQGVYNPHEVIAPPDDAIIFANALSPTGRYYIRFPYDIVDLATGKSMDLHLSGHFNKKNAAQWGYGNDTVEIPRNCVWYSDEQHAACAFVVWRYKGNDFAPVSILTFLSTTGAAPVITEISSPDSYISLETWLP